MQTAPATYWPGVWPNLRPDPVLANVAWLSGFEGTQGDTDDSQFPVIYGTLNTGNTFSVMLDGTAPCYETLACRLEYAGELWLGDLAVPVDGEFTLDFAFNALANAFLESFAHVATVNRFAPGWFIVRADQVDAGHYSVSVLDGADELNLLVGPTLAYGDRTRISAVRRGSAVELWVNAVKAGQIALATPAEGIGTVRFGAQGINYHMQFTWIDEVRVVDAAQSYFEALPHARTPTARVA